MRALHPTPSVKYAVSTLNCNKPTRIDFWKLLFHYFAVHQDFLLSDFCFPMDFIFFVVVHIIKCCEKKIFEIWFILL